MLTRDLFALADLLVKLQRCLTFTFFSPLWERVAPLPATYRSRNEPLPQSPVFIGYHSLTGWDDLVRGSRDRDSNPQSRHYKPGTGTLHHPATSPIPLCASNHSQLVQFAKINVVLSAKRGTTFYECLFMPRRY